MLAKFPELWRKALGSLGVAAPAGWELLHHSEPSSPSSALRFALIADFSSGGLSADGFKRLNVCAVPGALGTLGTGGNERKSGHG